MCISLYPQIDSHILLDNQLMTNTFNFLQDVLENEDISLEDMFVASLVKDLIQVFDTTVTFTYLFPYNAIIVR